MDLYGQKQTGRTCRRLCPPKNKPRFCSGPVKPGRPHPASDAAPLKNASLSFRLRDSAARCGLAPSAPKPPLPCGRLEFSRVRSASSPQPPQKKRAPQVLEASIRTLLPLSNCLSYRRLRYSNYFTTNVRRAQALFSHSRQKRKQARQPAAFKRGCQACFFSIAPEKRNSPAPKLSSYSAQFKRFPGRRAAFMLYSAACAVHSALFVPGHGRLVAAFRRRGWLRFRRQGRLRGNHRLGGYRRLGGHSRGIFRRGAE